MWGWIKDKVKKVGGVIAQAGGAIVRGARGIARGVFELFHAVTWVLWRVVGLPELIASLAGIRIRKKLRLKVVILPDANGQPLATTDAVNEVVEEAKRVFHRHRMKVRIIAPPGETTIASHFNGTVPDYVRRPECDAPGWFQRYKGKGRWYVRQSAPYWRRGGATVFVVDDVHSGAEDKSGCFLGLVNYGYIDKGALRPAGSQVPVRSPAVAATGPGPGESAGLIVRAAGNAFNPAAKMTLAHELGHACDLLHRTAGGPTPGNLMRPGHKERTDHLTDWQIAWVRSSHRVRYF